ncbi:MAG: sulfatase-like hydrolase/transferase [Bacteroidales bacterium]|nr:sulfatase-like hydrolase/transferase [Bacteroidales bacterium]
MKSYFSNLFLLFQRLFLVLILFLVTRLLFWILNYSYFSSLGTWETLKLFFFGIQFDVSAIIGFNSLFILLHLLPGNYKYHKNYQLALKIIFLTVNTFILAGNFIDCEYFKFTNKRITADILKYVFLSNDTINLLPQFIKDFWHLLLGWILLMTATWFIYSAQKQNITIQSIKPFGYILQGVLSVLLLGIFLVGFRGIRLKPYRIIDAARYTKTQFTTLVLNTPFTFLKTINKSDLQLKNYFPEEEIKNLYDPVHRFETEKDFSYQNVVIIILESFSREYIGSYNPYKGYTPFLDSLISHSLVFPNSFANGKRSIEAMPSIIASLPTLMNDSYISSSYSTNSVTSLANLLEKKGYSTSFFHGGSNGTMGFDNFANIAGIDEYYGRNEYNNEADYDGNWGIYDEEFLQYFAIKLNSFRQPFFSTLFTLSSHHPYNVPDKYKGKFQKGELNIHEVIQYTDYALKKFFETASVMPWYSNTLFVITADHTALASLPYYQNKVGQYAIPIFFFHPSDSSLIGTDQTLIQHCDILPSVMNYLNYDEPFFSFGYPVFNKTSDHFVINYTNGLYHLIQQDYCLFFDGSGSVSLFNTETDSLLQNNLLGKVPAVQFSLENKIKAIIQTYNNRLISNQMLAKNANSILPFFVSFAVIF